MTTPNIEELMKLADAYAAVTAGAVPDSDRYKIGLRTQEARAALHDALQSQAERIKTLEGQSIEVDKVLARENVSLRATLKQCESRLHDVATLCATVEIERDTLRAQLAEIAATEIVAHQFQTVDGGWHPFLDDKHYQNTKDDCRWPIRELFTRPMPAQDVTELVLTEAEALDIARRWSNSRFVAGSERFIIDYAREILAAAKYKGAK